MVAADASADAVVTAERRRAAKVVDSVTDQITRLDNGLTIATDRVLGARSVAITRSADKAERLRQLGATRVLVEGRDDYAAAVNEVSGGRGARVVFDPVGGAAVPRLAAAMASRGIYVLYGAMSGEVTPFPVAEAFDKLLTMGIFRLDYVNRPEELARGRAFLDAGLAAGHLKPVIDREFPLARVVEAHHYMAANGQVGKILLIP